VALRLRGSVGALDQGQALHVQQCGAPVRLAAGQTDILMPPRVFAPLLIQLHSPAPDGTAGSIAGGGAVLNSGHQAAGSFTGVRVAARGPSWLVLGESYNRGWSATCNGRSLGAPRVIDAFANGWPIASRCHAVSITFAPQTTVEFGYVAGGLACLALVLVLVLTRPGAVGRAVPVPPPQDRVVSWTPARALAAGLLGAAVIGFLFGLRAGAVAGPVFALLLWRGTPTMRIVQLAGVLLGVVVILYLIFPGRDLGGYDQGYPSQHLGAHWVTVGAFALLALALVRDLVRLSRASPGRRAVRPSEPAQVFRPRARA
jgi:hypothetical protein